MVFGKRYRDKETGIIYDENGRPCKTCNIFSSFRNVAQQPNSSTVPEVKSNTQLESKQSSIDCNTDAIPDSVSFPRLPDVAELGRSTWTFLHAMAANFPKNPTPTQQNDMSSFLYNFSKFYPCWSCAEDLRIWMAKDGNSPRVDSRESLCEWICEAHNDVNERLGKPLFNCQVWSKKASELAD